MRTTDTVELLKQLIAEPSITPNDCNCQQIIADRLERLDFKIVNLPSNGVSNLFAIRGNKSPTIAFAGHTDVVPAGNEAKWHTPPFIPSIRDGYLYGRGAADMKGSIAAMLTAVERFVEKYPDHPDSLAFLITSDEEGIATDGTVKIIEYLKENNIQLSACVVGEPSSTHVLGDTIKNGRRGSLTGRLRLLGIQGHVAYPANAENPIHKSGNIITELTNTVWDFGNDYFPPTTFQISNIKGGTGADNVIPGEVELNFNFRYSSEVTANDLKNKVMAILDKSNQRYELAWLPEDLPFLTKTGTFINSVSQAVHDIVGIYPQVATNGGTSDGRFIAHTGAHIVELGPINATIHSIDECVNLADLENLSKIYERILEIIVIRAKDEKLDLNLVT